MHTAYHHQTDQTVPSRDTGYSTGTCHEVFVVFILVFYFRDAIVRTQFYVVAPPAHLTAQKVINRNAASHERA